MADDYKNIDIASPDTLQKVQQAINVLVNERFAAGMSTSDVKKIIKNRLSDTDRQSINNIAEAAKTISDTTNAAEYAASTASFHNESYQDIYSSEVYKLCRRWASVVNGIQSGLKTVFGNSRVEKVDKSTRKSINKYLADLGNNMNGKSLYAAYKLIYKYLKQLEATPNLTTDQQQDANELTQTWNSLQAYLNKFKEKDDWADLYDFFKAWYSDKDFMQINGVTIDNIEENMNLCKVKRESQGNTLDHM